MTIWTAAEGLALAGKLERDLADLNVHLALAGSCMYQGFSSKDLDLIVYPHGSGTPLTPVAEVLVRLQSLGFSVWATKTCQPLDDAEAVEQALAVTPGRDSSNLVHVYRTHLQDGTGEPPRRVDFFFFMRPR